ncbi:MAG: lipopolysaccharide biosynthesis protein RfbH [Nitrospirae bacterium]|nr:lipopolysaccharide biosynthesis protein RfbH [Nitrospirota bacterium]
MKALVLGASGLVGTALSDALENSGVQVIRGAFRHVTEFAIRLDIRDARAIERTLEETRPEWIFLAVNIPGGVNACEEHPAEAREVLVDGIDHVCQAARTQGARLVYYSTDYIFDGTRGPYSEDDLPHPVNVYGRLKLEAEERIRSETSDPIIVRTTAVFGWNRLSRNFAMQIWEVLPTGKPMRVPSDEWCNPTLAEYLAEVTVRLVQRGAGGIFNVVGKDRMTRSDLGKQLAKSMSLDPDRVLPTPTAAMGPRATRPLQGGLTTGKLETLLGTDAMNLQEALKRFRRHWLSDTQSAHESRPQTGSAESLRRDILEKVGEYYRVAHRPEPFVPFKSRIQYSGRVYGENEMTNLVDSALEFWLTLGRYGDRFEREMKRFFGSRDFVLVNSGSSANLTAVLTLMSAQLDHPLRPGDEVITPAVTFPTTLAPLVHSGLVPVLVDCEIGTYNIDPTLVESALSPRTRAILVPHTLGNPCDMEILTGLAEKFRLFLIEDCCDALGGTFGDRRVGTFGDLATLSFYPAHHLTMGEGGGVVVNRSHLSRLVRSVRDWGRDCWCAPGESNTCGKRFGWELGDLPKGYDHKYTYSNLGYNFKPTDMQAAIGLAQFARLDEFIQARRRNFSRLYDGLQSYQDRLVLPRWDSRANPSWFGFPISVHGGASRFELVHWLETANIETREIFGGNILRQPAYRQIKARVAGSLAHSDRVMRDSFFIGVYPGLSDEKIDFVLERFRDFFRRQTAGRRAVV